MPITFLLAGVVGIIIIVRWYIVKTSASRRSVAAIPGPVGFPIVGNLFQLELYPQRQLRQWAHQYGDLFKLSLGWENWVYVNSPEAIKAIFEKQASSTAAKSYLPVVNDIVSAGKRLFLMSKGPKWRALRAKVQSQLSPVKSDIHKSRQELEANRLINAILADVNNNKAFFNYARRYTLNVMFQVTYGQELRNDEDAEEIYDILQDFSEITMSRSFLADRLPPLARLPVWMQWWRGRALATQRRQTQLWQRYWDEFKLHVDTDEAIDCLARQWILQSSGSGDATSFAEEQWAFLAGTMLEAGAATTSSTLLIALAHLAADERTQAIAYAEVRSVCGSRPPSFVHKAKCPYVRAIIQEILRLVPSTSNGIAHYTSEDVHYNGMTIPQGTIVVINTSALYHDRVRYEDPMLFRPERYLAIAESVSGSEDGSRTGKYAGLKGDVADAEHIKPTGTQRYVWGAGWRICPGMYLAENTLFIALAKLIWSFEIKPPFDDDGLEERIELGEDAFEEGRIVVPKPFKLRFVPRRNFTKPVTDDESKKES